MANLTDLEKMIRELHDIEAIKRLKAKYWRYVDKKLWTELAEVFTEDATLDYGDTHIDGGKTIAQSIREALGDTATAHGGHVLPSLSDS